MLTLLTLASGALWADSYRQRVNKGVVFSCGGGCSSIYAAPPRKFPAPPSSCRDVGLDASWSLGDGGDFLVRTWAGRIMLHHKEKIDLDVTVRERDLSIAGVAYEQRADSWNIYPFDLNAAAPQRPPVEIRHRYRGIAFPLWAPTAVFAIYPLFFILSAPILRRRHRRKRGLCVECGYDLSHSTDRCPECGARKI
ncbi:MAG: hypothetical protein H6818_03700 [Phycisphaerales bacterium]|nr:hypothetical protein [Phycisphaerales bacterium]MCB9863760.1 hypothetical protein [Phycisphaerales bacterium]